MWSINGTNGETSAFCILQMQKREWKTSNLTHDWAWTVIYLPHLIDISCSAETWDHETTQLRDAKPFWDVKQFWDAKLSWCWWCTWWNVGAHFLLCARCSSWCAILALYSMGTWHSNQTFLRVGVMLGFDATSGKCRPCAASTALML